MHHKPASKWVIVLNIEGGICILLTLTCFVTIFIMKIKKVIPFTPSYLVLCGTFCCFIERMRLYFSLFWFVFDKLHTLHQCFTNKYCCLIRVRPKFDHIFFGVEPNVKTSFESSGYRFEYFPIRTDNVHNIILIR